jgi:lysozyme
MKTSDAGLEFLKHQEGVRKDMYRDSIGLPTIGVGHKLTKDELSSGRLAVDGEWVPWYDGLTDLQVTALLRQDVTLVEAGLNADAVALSQHQFDALVSFVFNVGIGAYARSTLHKRLLHGALEAVPEQLYRWTYAGGMVSPGLRKRRQAEADYWNRPDVTVHA